MSRLLLLPPTVAGVPNQPAAGQFIVATGSANKVQGALKITYDVVTGRVTIAAPSSGAALTINNAGSSYNLMLLAASGGVYLGFTDGNAGNRVYQLTVGATGTGMFSIRDGSRGTDLLKIDSTAVASKTTVVGALGVNNVSPPVQVTGFGTPTGTGVISAFPGATATLAQCSQTIAQLITDLKAFGLYGA